MLLTGMLQLSSAEATNKACCENTHKTLRVHCCSERPMTCVDGLLKSIVE